MKKVLSLLVFAIVITGCDDGNLTQEDISFEDVRTQSCSNNDVIYKLKENEALLLEIPESSFTSEPTAVDDPTIININANNRVVYRFYYGKIETDNICETIPPATPVVVDQWNAADGQIQITTTMVKTTNATNNSTKITGYNHNIVFKNITFAKNNGTQVYETFPFGDYITTATNLPFNFDQTLEKCSDSNQVYNYNSSEAIILTVDPTLIANEATPLNSPRTGLIGTTQNILTYRLFKELLTADYFCKAVTPTIPAINQQWDAVAGVSDASGIIEVTTTTNGPGSFIHTIVLKKVILKKGNSNFTLGDSYTLGELITTI